jgi:hypothetical protein
MNTVLFNHPYRDSWAGCIVIPVRVDSNHSGDLVIYKFQGEDSEYLMSAKSWKKFCAPVVFNSEEGA